MSPSAIGFGDLSSSNVGTEVTSEAVVLTFKPDQIQATFSPQEPDKLRSLLSSIDNSLEALKTEPLYPRIVEEILRISAGERIRWAEDGRLPSAGSGSFSIGRQPIHFSLHAPQAIAALVDHPETIARWRRLDAQQPAASSPEAEG